MVSSSGRSERPVFFEGVSFEVLGFGMFRFVFTRSSAHLDLGKLSGLASERLVRVAEPRCEVG